MRALVVGLILLSLTTAAAGAAGVEDWRNLHATPPGREVAVDTKTGRRIQGKLVSVSDSAITVRADRRQEETLGRAEVFKVLRRQPPRHRRLYTGVGLGLGVIAGLGTATYIGLKHCLFRNCAAENVGLAAVAFGVPVAGALAGRALAGKGEFELVYLSQ